MITLLSIAAIIIYFIIGLFVAIKATPKGESMFNSGLAVYYIPLWPVVLIVIGLYYAVYEIWNVILIRR